MSRTRFWTILIGKDPTSFRASNKDTLVPTLKQLQRQHPESVIRWYERGALFDSPEQAAEEFDRRNAERRPKEWRPGGQHRDPRAKYQKSRDEKRRAFKARARRAAGAAPVERRVPPRPQRPRRRDEE